MEELAFHWFGRRKYPKGSGSFCWTVISEAEMRVDTSGNPKIETRRLNKLKTIFHWSTNGIRESGWNKP